MTQYYPLDSKATAVSMSEDAWDKVLARASLSSEVTRFLFRVHVHPTTDKSLVVVEDREYAMFYPLLTPAEKNNFDSNVLPADDPYVIDFLAAVEAARFAG